MIDNMTFGTLDVIAPQGAGGGLQLPLGFWEPGTLSAYKAHFGTGATLAPFSASAVFGPSPTAPLSINTLGMEVITGVRNLFGADSTIGMDMSFGALDVSYSALGNQINAALFDIVPSFENVAPKDSLTAALGLLNGGWLINGFPVSGEPDLTSDSRLKKNVKTYSGGLATILGLRPVRFDWREDKCPSSFLNEYREPDTKDGYPGKVKRQYGLIAQEVELLAPDLVGQRRMYNETYKLIRYEKIVPILVSAVQEQQEQIEELKREIKSLKENK